MHPAATRGTLVLLANDPESLIPSQALKRLVELENCYGEVTIAVTLPQTVNIDSLRSSP